MQRLYCTDHQFTPRIMGPKRTVGNLSNSSVADVEKQKPFGSDPRKRMELR